VRQSTPRTLGQFQVDPHFLRRPLDRAGRSRRSECPARDGPSPAGHGRSLLPRAQVAGAPRGDFSRGARHTGCSSSRTNAVSGVRRVARKAPGQGNGYDAATKPPAERSVGGSRFHGSLEAGGRGVPRRLTVRTTHHRRLPEGGVLIARHHALRTAQSAACTSRDNPSRIAGRGPRARSQRTPWRTSPARAGSHAASLLQWTRKQNDRGTRLPAPRDAHGGSP